MKDLHISKDEPNIILFDRIINLKKKLSLRCYMHTGKRDNLYMQDQYAIIIIFVMQKRASNLLVQENSTSFMTSFIGRGHMLETS